jgi:predicted dehydrogenase
VRIGILGFAHVHADGYVANLRAIPGVTLIGFSDDDRARGAAAAEQHGLRHHLRHEALLAERPDAVIVCSETAHHAEHVALAAAAGAHVLCEKPIEVTLAAARAMQDACERAGVTFMTAFPMRFDASVARVRAAMAAGELGRLRAVTGINHSEIPDAHRAWFAVKRLAGGGAVMDHTVHLTDLLRSLTGAEVTSVFAEVGNPFHPGRIDVDSAGLASLAMSDGVIASIDCSWSRPTTFPRWGHLKMELFGDRGSLRMDAFADALTLHAPHGGRNPAWVGFGADPNQAMVEEFVAALRTQRAPAVSWRDGFEALRVALACYASAERGAAVALADVT